MYRCVCCGTEKRNYRPVLLSCQRKDFELSFAQTDSRMLQLLARLDSQRSKIFTLAKTRRDFSLPADRVLSANVSPTSTYYPVCSASFSLLLSFSFFLFSRRSLSGQARRARADVLSYESGSLQLNDDVIVKDL